MDAMLQNIVFGHDTATDRSIFAKFSAKILEHWQLNFQNLKIQDVGWSIILEIVMNWLTNYA